MVGMRRLITAWIFNCDGTTLKRSPTTLFGQHFAETVLPTEWIQERLKHFNQSRVCNISTKNYYLSCTEKLELNCETSRARLTPALE